MYYRDYLYPILNTKYSVRHNVIILIIYKFIHYVGKKRTGMIDEQFIYVIINCINMIV